MNHFIYKIEVSYDSSREREREENQAGEHVHLEELENLLQIILLFAVGLKQGNRIKFTMNTTICYWLKRDNWENNYKL